MQSICTPRAPASSMSPRCFSRLSRLISSMGASDGAAVVACISPHLTVRAIKTSVSLSLRFPLTGCSSCGRLSADLLPRLGDFGHLPLVDDVVLEVAAPRADEALDLARRRDPRSVDVSDAGPAAAV